MPTKKHGPVTFNLSDNRYDKPFRYLKKHKAYLVTLQTKTRKQPAIYDVVPDGGDRALPKGIIQTENRMFHAFLYPPVSTDLYLTKPVGDFYTLDDAIASILSH